MKQFLVKPEIKIFALLLFALGIKIIYIFSVDGTANPEIINYTKKSLLLDDPHWHYLGVSAFGGGWRIPSFLFFPLNHLGFQLFGHNGFFNCACGPIYRWFGI